MKRGSVFFAGGGTGGHIYPAIAIAEKIIKLQPETKIHFFCSGRDIDSKILSKSGFDYSALPAKGFSIRPAAFLGFIKGFCESVKIAKEQISAACNPVVVGVGGFVAAPVCRAGVKLNVPVVLLNVDIVPGKANKLIGRWADEIFVQFEETRRYFAKAKKIHVVGCPLRKGFDEPQPKKVIEQFSLDKNKKILLVTGASSGSENINQTICSLLTKLDAFADSWQIVHLAGRQNFENVMEKYKSAKIGHRILDYFDDMADLLSAADLVIGRSGAVSVAEYAAAGVPSICMPYPYHKDMHQYLNAGILVEAGAAIMVDDLPDADDRAEWLWDELEELLKDEDKLRQMKANTAMAAKKDAAYKIAESIFKM